MKDLNYDHSLYYSLKEKHKSLEIKDFKTKNILGSNYIQKNHDLPIQSTPHFINERTVNQYYFSKKEPLILICYSGAKSKKLADDLCQQGYDAYSIEGGFYSILHQKT